MKEVWRDLVRQALVGTARQPFRAPKIEGPLGDLVRQTVEETPEKGLLDALSLLFHCRVIGEIPIVTDVPGRDAQNWPLPEKRPACTDRAAALLKDAIIDGMPATLIEEGLALLSRHGRRVPDWLLPRLFDWGAGKPEAWAVIAGAVGENGRWLAELNSRWHGLLNVSRDDENSEWLSGSAAEKRRAFLHWRGRDPEGARVRLEKHFATEQPDERAGLVAGLKIGLSEVDQPFLQQAMNDKSKTVRREAARLLLRLGDADASRIVKDAGAACMQVSVSWMKPRLDVELPEAFDPGWRQLGLDQRVPAQVKLGERSWWLFQLLSLISPGHWREAFGLTARQLLEAARGSMHRKALYQAWREAAILHDDADHAEADLSLHVEDGLDEYLGLLKEYHHILPSERFETLLIQRLPDSSSRFALAQAASILGSLSERVPGGWSRALCRALSPWLTQLGSPPYDARLLSRLVHQLHPAFFPVLEPALIEAAREDDRHADKLAKAHDLYRFRHLLHKEFEE